jgi:hypothetical protein
MEPEQIRKRNEVRDSWPKMDRAVIEFVDLKDQGDDREVWRDKTPQQRLEALEVLRQMIYGQSATARLQRVFELARLELR